MKLFMNVTRPTLQERSLPPPDSVCCEVNTHFPVSVHGLASSGPSFSSSIWNPDEGHNLKPACPTMKLCCVLQVLPEFGPPVQILTLLLLLAAKYLCKNIYANKYAELEAWETVSSDVHMLHVYVSASRAPLMVLARVH